MSRLRQAAANSGWVFAGRAAERLVRIGVIIVLARTLGARGFGVYSFAFAYAEIFSVFTDAGIYAILVRELSKGETPRARLMGCAFFLKGALAALSWLAAFLFAGFYLPGGETRWTAIVAISILFVSFRVASFRSLFDAPFEADLEMGVPIRWGVASEALSAALVVYAAWNRWPLPAIVGVQVAALLPGAVWMGRVSFRKIRPDFRFDYALSKRLLSMALPMGVAQLCLIAYTSSDIFMLRWLGADLSVGLYAAAYKLTGSLGIIPGAMTATLLPLLARVKGAGDMNRAGEIYRGAVSIAVAAGLPFVAGGLFFSAEVISFLYGADYQGSVPVLRVLAGGVVFHFVLYILTTSAVSIGRERWFALYAVLLAAMNLAGNALLIPRFGAAGAAWSTFFTEGALAVAGWAALRRELGNPDFRAGIRALLAALAAGAVLGWLPAPLAVRLAGGGVLYMILIHWGRGLSPEGHSAVSAILSSVTRSAPAQKQ